MMNVVFNVQMIGMILIIENEIFVQNIVEKWNGDEIFGKLVQRVVVEKEVWFIEIDLQIVVYYQW